MAERKTEELNSRKVPIVTIDESLDQYNDTILSPSKQAKYDEILRVSGHPEDALKKIKGRDISRR